ncbi:MAG: nucleotide exchange factor GrpE [Thermoleophilia bacterium]|nr:nucleotide exchange factor GrpE [Thermoleophilia bacterium]
MSTHDPVDSDLPAESGEEPIVSEVEAEVLEEELDPLALAERERDDYLDQLRRLAAEFDNYKKRMAREHEELRERAAERLLRDLLPVFDDLGRALTAFETAEHEAIADGVALVHRALWTLLEREGVAELDPTGDMFDPHRHEALLSQPADAPEGTVLEVIQKGFLLGDRVLRPARVVVSGGAS